MPQVNLSPHHYSLIMTIFLFVAGWVLAHVASQAAERVLSHYSSKQHAALIKKIVYFIILILFSVTALQQLGFKLGALLGSAGIATAAIAIASQTTVSNMIGGLFLIMEKSFYLGDRIQIGNTTGTVESIDLLSVKILTDNHVWVRIPNETLIRTELMNLTRSENRRIDFPIKLDKTHDLQNLKSLLIQLAKADTRCLPTPSPTVTVLETTLESVTLQLSVWAKQEDYTPLRNDLYEAILPQMPVPAILRHYCPSQDK